jgi:hypothetical protein
MGGRILAIALLEGGVDQDVKDSPRELTLVS